MRKFFKGFNILLPSKFSGIVHECPVLVEMCILKNENISKSKFFATVESHSKQVYLENWNNNIILYNEWHLIVAKYGDTYIRRTFDRKQHVPIVTPLCIHE